MDAAEPPWRAIALAPDQRLFVAWLAHLVRGRLHLLDALAAAVVDADDLAAARRDAVAIRRVAAQLLRQLDELAEGRPGAGRAPP
jgi:hypothetical protein